MGIDNPAIDASHSIISGLTHSSAYPHEVSAINIIETHISWVLLTGKYAYKIKKPVNFGFLDFSTLDKRQFFCNEEIRLNQRLTPDLYLDVVPIIGNLVQPKIGGVGEVIEYAVKMLQFPDKHTLNELAEKGELGLGEIDQLTEIIADFHNNIEKAEVTSSYGHSEDIKHWFEENIIHIRPLLSSDDQKHQLNKLIAWGNNEWNNKVDVMEQRRRNGYVRECHGDLHLSNMTLINGKVTLFDCIEFNPLLRWIDVISEVAFIFIDLLYFGYERFAYRLLNDYLKLSGDYQAVTLLRYYVVYRALVCAKVALLREAQQKYEKNSHQRCPRYNKFANLAERFTKISPVTLIITHGYSGSGKSTVSGKLAEAIGALKISSDVERKRLYGYAPLANTESAIDSGLYTNEVIQHTYRHLANCAKNILLAGFSAIIDASFLKIEQRKLFQKLAVECGVRFIIIDFKASYEELCRRITERQNDVSEATIGVLNNQLKSEQPLSDQEQEFVISINTDSDNALDKILVALG